MGMPEICGAVRYDLIKESGPAGSFAPVVDSTIPSVSAESTNPNEVGGYVYTLRSQSTFYPQLFIDRELFVTID